MAGVFINDYFLEIEGDGFTGACCWGSLGMEADGGCFVTGHCGQGPQTLRMRWISVGIRVLL